MNPGLDRHDSRQVRAGTAERAGRNTADSRQAGRQARTDTTATAGRCAVAGASTAAVVLRRKAEQPQ